MADELLSYSEEANDKLEMARNLRVLPALRNWQVIEIDGEATRVEEKPVTDPAPTNPVICEQLDDVIGADLTERHITVNAGETANFQLSLWNNGDRTGLFSIAVEGWIQESWLQPSATEPEAPFARQSLPTLLHPGERTTLNIALTPPRAAQTRAGDHAVAIVVRAPEYPEHISCLVATLTIAPYTKLVVGQCRPPQASLSWFKRTSGMTLPLTNQGNQAIDVQLRTLDRTRYWHSALMGGKRQMTITLQPGQKRLVPVQVQAQHLPLFGSQKRHSLLQIAVAAREEGQSPQTISANVVCAPLVGPWQLATLVSFFLLSLVGVGLFGFIGLVLWRTSLAHTIALPAPVVQAAPAPQVITMVINLPIATPAPIVANAPAENSQPTPGNTAPVAGAPFVQAAQITGPGTPAPVLQPVAAPAVVQGSQPAPRNLTYQQMFQEVGRRYDLNWRLLAAQAYVESSFDAVALSKNGAMGLMQIVPATWREWSPQVNVSDPFDSYSNALVAAAYLDYLRTLLSQHQHPQPEWMLVAYSWGIDKVLRHLDQGLGWDELPPEYRQYAEDILRIATTIPTN